jgi:hypothetical protein
MNRYILAFLLVIAISSCNSDDELKINNSDLVGTWNWTSTDGGLANHIHATPASTGKTIQLYLMKNYKFSITENGNEVTKGTYELTIKKSIYSGEMARFIQYSEIKNSQNTIINGIITIYGTNNLSISDNNYDGIGSEFEKQN